MAILYYVGVCALLFLLYHFVRLVQLVLSDCDLKLRACAQKPEYFKNKVVWLVGASGGSKSIMQGAIIVISYDAANGVITELWTLQDCMICCNVVRSAPKRPQVEWVCHEESQAAVGVGIAFLALTALLSTSCLQQPLCHS